MLLPSGGLEKKTKKKTTCFCRSAQEKGEVQKKTAMLYFAFFLRLVLKKRRLLSPLLVCLAVLGLHESFISLFEAACKLLHESLYICMI